MNHGRIFREKVAKFLSHKIQQYWYMFYYLLHYLLNKIENTDKYFLGDQKVNN